MTERMKVLANLSAYFDVPVEKITSNLTPKEIKVFNITSDKCRWVKSRKREEVEARWCFWTYLIHNGWSRIGIARAERMDHSTVIHGMKNNDLVLNRQLERIIYGMDL